MRGLGGWLGSQAKEFISELRQGPGDELGSGIRLAQQQQTSTGEVAEQCAQSSSTKPPEKAASSAALREQLAASTAAEDVGWDDEDDEQSPAAASTSAAAVVPATGPQEHLAAQECIVAAVGNPPLEILAHDESHKDQLETPQRRVDNEVSRLKAQCVELEQAAQAAKAAQSAQEAELSLLRARCAKLEAANAERDALQKECAGLRSEVTELRVALQAARSGLPSGAPPASKAASTGTAVCGSDKLVGKNEEEDDVAWDDEDAVITGTG